VDLGLNNLATCVSTNGASFIVDGRKLKSYNQWYNKSNAKLQSIKDKQGIKNLTKRQGRLLLKRNNQIRDYLSKTARYIIENCLRLDIGTLVVGINKGWKQDINIGKRINQNFVQIPFYSLKEKLKSLCKTYGIQYVEQEESYTSKASALDNDDIPIYNPNNTVKYTFSGKRIKRGLYLSKDNIRINADCNGAWNIGRKSKHEGFSQVSSGLLTSPLRISDLNVSLS
jgi:IS605 OrfB family transposase